MKKMLVAGLLALAVTAVSQQQASAWCKFSIGLGINLSYESTGHTWTHCFSCVSNPPPACYGGYGVFPLDSIGDAGYSAAYGYAYTGYNYGYGAQQTQAAPATQQVGYSYYPQYSYAQSGYGYGW